MELPPDVELVTDVSVADWVPRGLHPWGGEGPIVATVVPEGFDAYARLQHVGPEGTEGELPPEQMERLIGVLASFTSIPARCWFCVWDGYGFWFRGSHATLLTPGSRPDRDSERRSRKRDRLMRRTPRVKAEGRDYFLFRGPLSAAHALRFDDWPQPPNLWWPDDRAWCVATDIDLPWTYVGGSRDCLRALLNDPLLRASEVSPGDSIA